MMKILNTENDKDGMVSITIVIVTSYIVFYTPHATLIFIRFEKFLIPEFLEFLK